MIVDKVNAYLSGEGRPVPEAILAEVGKVAQVAFSRQFGEREEKPGTLRLSSIGKCIRAQAYNKLGFEPNGKVIDARSKVTFFMGDITELAVIGLIRLAGLQVEDFWADQRTVTIMGIEGHPDGIVTIEGVRYLLEVKSMSSYAFREFEQGKIDESYIWQFQAYMSALGLSKVIMVALNKDAGVLSEQVREFHPLIAQGIRERIALLKTVKKEALPNKPYGPDEKTGFLPWQCLYCAFYGHCWPAAQKVVVSGKYKLKFKPEEKSANASTG